MVSLIAPRKGKVRSLSLPTTINTCMRSPFLLPLCGSYRNAIRVSPLSASRGTLCISCVPLPFHHLSKSSRKASMRLVDHDDLSDKTNTLSAQIVDNNIVIAASKDSGDVTLLSRCLSNQSADLDWEIDTIYRPNKRKVAPVKDGEKQAPLPGSAEESVSTAAANVTQRRAAPSMRGDGDKAIDKTTVFEGHEPEDPMPRPQTIPLPEAHPVIEFETIGDVDGDVDEWAAKRFNAGKRRGAPAANNSVPMLPRFRGNFPSLPVAPAFANPERALALAKCVGLSSRVHGTDLAPISGDKNRPLGYQGTLHPSTLMKVPTAMLNVILTTLLCLRSTLA